MPDFANGESFSGEIRVASRIIDYLSSGLYKSPAACLKELINNSYDADARNVQVLVKPDAKRIIIEDDGFGMNRMEFQSHFDRISESHKRDETQKTASGRPIIGKIGIGFIAANELCDLMEVFSTKNGESELLHVSINFNEMRKPLEDRRRDGNDFVKADYVGEVLETEKGTHYTQIYLESVRGEARDILAGAAAAQSGMSDRTLYGLSPESICRELSRIGINSWKDFDTYSETMLKVALNVPVPYVNSWLPTRLQKDIQDFETISKNLNFCVNYDGTELKKPTVFGRDAKALIRRFEFKGKNVSAQGYFYAQHGIVKPIELHGLLIRIRHAAVGDYDPSFWEFSPSEFSLIQRWVSAEIWADDRLEEAMNIDRRTLRDTHPAYVELRQAVHENLRQVCRTARKLLYEKESTNRKQKRAGKALDDIRRLAKENVASVSPTAAKELEQYWTVHEIEPNVQRALLKKYTVADFYEIVVEVASEVLSPSSLARFLKRLTERLSK